MAVEQKVTCDRCRSVILENRNLLQIASGTLRIHRECVDLCGDCSDLFAGWLAEGNPTGPTAA